MTTQFPKPKVVAKLQVGDIIRFVWGDGQIVLLPDGYDRNAVACYKTATIQDCRTGKEFPQRLYGNQRYYVMNRD